VRRVLALLGAVLLLAAACSGDDDDAGGDDRADAETGEDDEAAGGALAVDDWVYQLQGYADESLDELAATPQPIAVIDLTRDGLDGYWTAEEIAALQGSGKTVLAYFEIGSIEDFRPEYAALPDELILNRWEDWPEEHFVRYWEAAWWDTVVQPRVDQALEAGFDGVYLDTPLAYEEIDLSLVDGEDRDSLARKMADLVVRISEYGKERDDAFMVVPQNNPELREQDGYTEAIDGLGVEDLFFSSSQDQPGDIPCDQDYCAENLAHTRALRDAGKLVLAVDYASDPDNIAEACRRYQEEGFTGYVTQRALDSLSPPCP
jgi:cysteinyl-tRNA synthetase, unknown class